MAQQYGNGGTITVSMEGPFGGSGTAVKLTEITLLAANWKGAISPYSQVVGIEDISVSSQVDLQLSVEQVEAFRNKTVAFTVENNGGVVTAYAIGDKPEEDYTFQATVMEVVA